MASGCPEWHFSIVEEIARALVATELMKAINQGVIEDISRWISKAWKSLLSGSDADDILSFGADASQHAIKLIITFQRFDILGLVHRLLVKCTKGSPK